MHDEPAYEEPPTTRIYLQSDKQGNRMIESATVHPPSGPLDGWSAIDVDAEAWEAFAETRRAHDRAVQQAAIAGNKYEEATARLAEEIDR